MHIPPPFVYVPVPSCKRLAPRVAVAVPGLASLMVESAVPRPNVELPIRPPPCAALRVRSCAQGYLAHKTHLLGPYSRTIPRVIWWSEEGGGGSCERCTPVQNRA